VGRIELKHTDWDPIILFAGDLYVEEDHEQQNIEQPLIDFIKSHELFGANIEAPICSKGSRQEKYSALRMTPGKAIPLIKELGLRIALLANNHVMDYGAECLSETISYLKEADILYLGAGLHINDAFRPLTLNIHGVRITIINFTTVFTLQSLASIDRPGIAGMKLRTEIHADPYEIFEEPGAPYIVDAKPFQEDLETITDLVEKSSRSSDLTITYIHWGVGALPYSRIILKYMRELSSVIIDRGSSIIIGSHPHILLPSEKINKGIAIYSLGNFLFTHKPKDLLFSNVGGMASIWFSKNKEEFSITLLPLCLNSSGVPMTCPEDYSNIPEIVEFVSISRSMGVRVSPLKWDSLNLLQIAW